MSLEMVTPEVSLCKLMFYEYKFIFSFFSFLKLDHVTGIDLFIVQRLDILEGMKAAAEDRSNPLSTTNHFPRIQHDSNE